MQARWFAALNTGRVSWPSRREIEAKLVELDTFRKSMYQTTRHGLEVNYMPYMQSIAHYLNVAPNLAWYAVTDPKLFYQLIFGPFTTYQFRLQGPHKWAGARDAILNVAARIDAPFKAD